MSNPQMNRPPGSRKARNPHTGLNQFNLSATRQGLSSVLQLGAGLPAILPDAAVLLGFAAVFFVVGINRFKFE